LRNGGAKKLHREPRDELHSKFWTENRKWKNLKCTPEKNSDAKYSKKISYWVAKRKQVR